MRLFFQTTTRFLQMRAATMKNVRERHVFILWGIILTTFFTLQARKKGKGPPAKRAKKGSGATPAKQSSTKGSRQKKSLSLLPTMPLDVLFEVEKYFVTHPCSRLIDSLRFSRISLPRTLSTFLEQVEFSEILWWREMQASYGRLQGCDVGCQSAPLLWASHNGLSFYSGTFVRFAKI